jgi:hypothetical protein
MIIMVPTMLLWFGTHQPCQKRANYVASIDQMVHSDNSTRPGEGENLYYSSVTSSFNAAAQTGATR